MVKSFFDWWFQKIRDRYETVTDILARCLIYSAVLGSVGVTGVGVLLFLEGSPLWDWLLALTFVASVLVVMTSAGLISGLNKAKQRATDRRIRKITRKTDFLNSWL